jgi:hypothetical protein
MLVTIRSGEAAAEIGSEAEGGPGVKDMGVGVGRDLNTGPWPNARPVKPQSKIMMVNGIKGNQRRLNFMRNLVDNIAGSEKA